MKKLTMTLMILAVLSLLFVGCGPPQDRHAEPAEGGTCPCCTESSDRADHADHGGQASAISESDAAEDVTTNPGEPAVPEQTETEVFQVTGESLD